MKVYDSYKDTNIKLVKKIPLSWNIFPLCSIATLRKDINHTDKELLSVFLNEGVIKFSEITTKRTNTTSTNLDKYQLVKKGDFVLNNQQAWRGSVGVSEYEGIVSPAYIVLHLNKKKIDSIFANYLFRDVFSVSQYLIGSQGVGTIQRNLYWNNLKRISVILPPLNEQKAIANFLNEKSALIDKAINLKETEIERLKEYKQATIQKLVTQGLDPDVEMKDSGISWLGNIPKHWGKFAIKYCLAIPITDGPHTTPTLIESGIPFISAEAIKNNKIDFSKKRGFISLVDHQLFCMKYKPQLFDIYMVKSGATTGNIAIVETEDEFSIWSPLAVFRANQNIIRYKFLFYFLQSFSFRKGVELSWSFGTQQNIGMGVLSNLPIAIPPLTDQKIIVKELDVITQNIDKSIQLKLNEIEKLKEYKRSLINDAVTGKISVL